ncbi:hypothetical protein [Petrachloros mirabilis]
MWASPPAVRYLGSAVVVLVAWLTVNWLYHAIYKPTEILFPLEASLSKSPSATWKEYAPLFREHSTTVISPELLAALAQIEGEGNPAARTYWRWRLTWNPLEWYQPASSAVGMFQITDGTFEQAKRYCIHEHKVVEAGPWHDMNSCWFNSLYSRVLPSHAIEMTAALLDRHVASAMKVRRSPSATLQGKQDLAAVIHLCGAGAGQDFARRGFRPTFRQHCGDHELKTYLAKVNSMKRLFAHLSTGERTIRKAR